MVLNLVKTFFETTYQKKRRFVILGQKTSSFLPLLTEPFSYFFFISLCAGTVTFGYDTVIALKRSI